MIHLPIIQKIALANLPNNAVQQIHGLPIQLSVHVIQLNFVALAKILFLILTIANVNLLITAALVTTSYQTLLIANVHLI